MATHAYCPDPDDSGITFNLRDDDSDDAPEEVPVSQSKEIAEAALSAEQKGKKDARDLKKQKRQKTEAFFKQQKEEKLKRLEILASKKLPDDLFDNISSMPLGTEEKGTNKKRGKHITFKHTHKKFDSDHYIPLETGSTSSKFKMAVLGTKKWKDLSKPGTNPAQSFRYKALNNSKIRRISVNEMHNSMAKQMTADKFKLVGGS